MNVRTETPKTFVVQGPTPQFRTQKHEVKGTRSAGDETIPQPRCGTVPGDDPEIDDPSHGFSDGDIVGWDGSDYVKAQANAAGTPGIGMVYNATEDSYNLAFHGVVEIPSHGFSTGLNYLSPDTAGEMTTTLPGIGEKIQVVAFVYGSDEVFINPLGRSTP